MRPYQYLLVACLCEDPFDCGAAKEKRHMARFGWVSMIAVRIWTDWPVEPGNTPLDPLL